MVVPQSGALPLDPDAPPPPPARPTLDVALAVAAGGAIGGALRWGVNHLLPQAGAGFPWATFAENVSGAFVLGFVVVLITGLLPGARRLRPFLATGVLGGYTTFSAYADEIRALLATGHGATGLVYLFSTLFVGLAASALGIFLGSFVVQSRRVASGSPLDATASLPAGSTEASSGEDRP